MPSEPTRLVLDLEPGVVHPLTIALLVGQGEGGEEVLEGHVPVWVDGREDKGVGIVGALSLLALDVVEAPGPRHDGRGVCLLVVLVLMLLTVALCACLWQGCRGECEARRMTVLASDDGSVVWGVPLALP